MLYLKVINLPFDFYLSEDLRAQIKLLSRKDKETADALNKKIKQITSSDYFTIDHYKNLRYGMSNYKRVHIMKSFVLLFMVDKDKNFILFDKFGHHDDIYKKKN